MLLEAASLKSFAHSLIYEYLGKTGVKLADFCGDIIGALLILFIGSTLILSALMVVVGVLVEKTLKFKPWDFSSSKFSIGNYITFPYALFLGLLGMLLVGLIIPVLRTAVEAIPFWVSLILVLCFCGIIVIDYVFSMITTIRLLRRIAKLKNSSELMDKGATEVEIQELEENYKVKVSSIEAARGEILDRQGKYLAQNGQITTIGIVPGKLGENKEEGIKKLSELTGVSIEYINTELSRSYVKDDTFVPIKKISKDDNERKEALLKIPGVKLTNTSARVYPLGEEAAHLIGYVQKINEQELEQNEEKGYSSSSVIGKNGLEKAYEDRLRAVDGKEIIVVDEKGNKIKQLAKQDKKDGEDI